jgi:hypothetical protein
VLENRHEENCAAVDGTLDKEHRDENRTYNDPSLPFPVRHAVLDPRFRLDNPKASTSGRPASCRSDCKKMWKNEAVTSP